MSREELIEEYDERASSTTNALSLIQQEIHHRDQKSISNQMRFMTALITLLTIVNVGLVAYQVLS
jgi:hypothetical protein